MRITHSWSDKTATICIEGLNDLVRVVHITDSHLVSIDERDADFIAACERSCQAFRTRRQDDEGNFISPEDSFEEALSLAVFEDFDLIALTGDIVHFPSKANVERAASALSSTGVPMLYTAGNHDWLFPGEDAYKVQEAAWQSLEPLHAGRPHFGSLELGGIRFIAIDNSTYQITDEQVEFARKELHTDVPVVLLMHIPLSLPTLRDRTIERWKAPILIGDPAWDIQSRMEWGTGEDQASTLEFVRLVASAPSLVAVLCGHVHFPHTDAINLQAAQYVGCPCFDGGYRVIEFRPLVT
jgi:predicted MPP superfamily phosphohydrolase